VARFQSPPTPIVPLMLIDCEPPFTIYRLQWIDFRGAEADPARYRGALDRLLETMDKVVQGAALLSRNIKIEPLDFDLYLAAKVRNFIGREWLVAEVLHQLSRPEPNTLLLIGEPGWGKTAFAGHLFTTNPNGQLIAAHFCRADRSDTIDPRRFVESIAAMTALRLPAYADRLRRLLDADPKSGNETEMFERLFIQPLATVDTVAFGQIPRYLLVDGLDEAVSATGASTLAHLLSQGSALLPDWLRLIVTTRDAFGILGCFPSATVIRLDNGDPRNHTDISLLIANRLKPSAREETGDDVDILPLIRCSSGPSARRPKAMH